MTDKYQVINSEYLNTGGNCMVHISTVYFKPLKQTQYVFINEEWLVVASYDYIRNELPDGMDCEDFMLYSVELQHFTHEPSFDTRYMIELPKEITELLFDCYLLFIRAYCKYTGDNYACRLGALPNELYDQVTREYSRWLAENELDPVTDGYKIIVDPHYTALLKADTPNGHAAHDLQEHLTESIKRMNTDDENDREKWYNEKLVVMYCGKIFVFDNGADVYNGLDDFAKFVISEQ